jgi:hypothetical protein
LLLPPIAIASLNAMMLDTKRRLIRTWGMVGVSALALVLVAAESQADRNWARIRELPPDRRSKLLQNLRKFDLELSSEKRAAIRDLDRRIQELDPSEQARYYWVLRRYHDWLNSLPENRQDELLGQSPGERMATIRKLIADHPLPSSETPRLLQIAEVGEFSPFELASAFRIWQKLDPNQRKQVESMPQESGRRTSLFRLGKGFEKPIPRETRPPDYDEEQWIGRLPEHWRKTQMHALVEPVAKKRQDDAAKSGEVLDEAAKLKAERLEVYRKEIIRRQAINLYLSSAEVRPVQPERLSKFVAALPRWIQTAIEKYPPDEARRRVTFAYRLVFPHPEEIGEIAIPSAPPAKGAGAPAATPKKKGGTAPGKRKAAPRSQSNAPF